MSYRIIEKKTENFHCDGEMQGWENSLCYLILREKIREKDSKKFESREIDFGERLIVSAETNARL